jgi:hypothetical protein
MIAAIYTPKDIQVRIIDALAGMALIETLDGSRPFIQEAARDDPELRADYVHTDWTWAGRSEISGVYTL